MRRSLIILLTGIVALIFQAAALGGEYKLLNGDILRGDPASYNDDGLIVHLESGGFSPRVGWGKFTQDSLKELAKVPEAKKFVDPFIEIPIEIKHKERTQKKQIVLKDVPRVERPASKPSFFASLTNPVGLAVLLMLYLGNLYAAFEIAHFRGRPVALVCGLAAILPFVGPLMFLAMPPGEEMAAESAEAPQIAPAGEVVSAETRTGAPTALGLAAGAEKKGATQQATFKRGDTTFNRRFFETQFPGFFRMVPSEADKDLVLLIKTPKAEHTAKRISRITANDLHIILLRGGAEVQITFGEVIEVQLKHKDAKG